MRPDIETEERVRAYAIRCAGAHDFPAILRLNSDWVHFTSPLDPGQLSALHAQSAYHRVVADENGHVVAFLLALREGRDYASVNYRWFDSRGGEFLYIDRVIVDAPSHGRGLARLLYEDLLDFARETGVSRVVCELDIDPPNEPSRRFHDALGFIEVGTQLAAGGKKRVSLRELEIA